MKYDTEQLQEQLEDIQSCYIDGRSRLVEESDEIEADGETWGIVSDHGNVELGHRGRNGRLYYHGGLV